MIRVILISFSALYYVQVTGETVRAYCFETEAGYRAVFRIRKDQPEDSVIEGLEAYNASINLLAEVPIGVSDVGCNTITSVPEVNHVFALSIDFSTSSSTCGSVGDTVLIRALGTGKFWEFSCSDPNVISYEISQNNVNTGGKGDFHRHMPNPFDVKLQAFEANGYNTPVTKAHLGQDIILRMIYNKGQIESGPDNWGMTFHTGFVPRDTVTDLFLQIVTPGLGTKVHITGKLTDHELDLWVSVKRDSAVEVTIPAAYMETDALLFDWTIQSRGIKIESMHDRIGIRSIGRNGSFILSPDDILGTEYNGISLVGELPPAPPNQTVSNTTRLTGGPAENSGYVEVYHDNEWRPICDDFAGPEEALVVCRSLGYMNGPSSFYQGGGNLPNNSFWLDDLFCNGTEISIEECPNDGWGIHNCVSSETFTVTCHLNTEDNIVIVAVDDDTSIDIVYNNYSPRGGLNVNGVDAEMGSSTNDIVLNEYDSLNIRCNPGKCFHLKFLSDKPIAVMFGSDVTSQLLPVINYDDYFILITTDFGGQGYIAQHEDPTNIDDVIYNDYYGDNLTLIDFPFVTSYETEHLIEFPVGYYLFNVGGGCSDPYLFPMPSIDQWGAFNYFYAKEGSEYYVIFVGRIGEVANIAFKTGSAMTNLVGSTLGEQPDFSTIILNELYERETRYEQYNVSIFVSDTRPGIEGGLLEFRGAAPVNTFLMIIEEYADYYVTVYQPFGVRYPTSNPCVPTSFVRPGDLLNNDCDEYTDEEIANGLDDDDDGYVDEDLALDVVSPATGIYASELILCTDVLCTSGKLIHKFGCYDYYDVYGEGSYVDIGSFRHNTFLADEFDNYYVIDTPSFDAFRYVNDDAIHFMVTYGMCFGNLTKCENSCLETTEKRSIQEVNGVKLSLSLIRNHTNTIRKSGNEGAARGRMKPHPCSDNPVFMVTMLLLLVILFVEVVPTMFFVYKWYQFRRILCS